MKKKQSHSYIWTAFSDLLSGLLLTFVLIFIYQSSEISKYKKSTNIHNPRDLKDLLDELKRIRQALADAQAEIERLKQENKNLEDKIKKEKIGTSKEIASSVVKDLNKLNIGARLNEKSGTIEIDESVLFAPSSYTLPEDGQKKQLLIQMGTSLHNLLKNRERSKYISSIMVIGHADQEGDWTYNQDMSTRRANTLVTLWNNQILKTYKGDVTGCEVPKLVAAGIGEARPLIHYRQLTHTERHTQCEHHVKRADGTPINDSNGAPLLDTTQIGCKKNRRIEIMIIPKMEDNKVIPQLNCP